MTGTVAWIGTGKVSVDNSVADVIDSTSLATNSDTFIEGTASVSEKVSAGNAWGALAGASINNDPFNFLLSGNTDHIFVWMQAFGTVNSATNGGFGIVVVDDLTTDSVGRWSVGPREGFTGGWVPYVIWPSKDFSAVIVAGSGSWTTTGNPNQLNGIDGIGAYWDITSSVMGASDNAFFDAIAVGEGYEIIAGTIGSPATFSDIISFEENTTTGRYGGLVSSSGIIFPQSKIVIGDISGSSDTYFSDTGFTIVWLDSKVFYAGSDESAVDTALYEFNLTEDTGNTDVILSNGTISCDGIAQTLTVNFNGVTSVDLSNIAIDNAQGGITLDGNVTWDLGTISGSGQVDLGGQPTFTNIAFVNNSDEYALEVSATNEMTNVSDLSFSGHGNGTANSGAIYLNFASDTGTRTVSLTNITFSNRGTSNNDVVIAAGVGTGLVEISLSGTTLTAANVLDLRATDNFTILQNQVTLTLTGLVANSEVRVFDGGTTTELAGTESSTTSFGYTYTYSAGANVDIVILHSDYVYIRLDGVDLTAGDSSIPIQQQFDRVVL